MRLTGALALLPLATAAPVSFGEWAGAVSKTVSWLAGSGTIPDQLVVGTGRVDEQTLWDVLKGRDEFSKLVEFIEKDDHIQKLLSDKEKGVTFFAPNNEAIEKVLPHHKHSLSGGDDDKKREERKKKFIHEMLTYHILPQEIDYSHLGQNSTLATELHAHDGSIGGHRRRVKVESSLLPPWKVTINSYSHVTESDIRGVNGIIHKIDTPLFLPVDAMDAMFMFPHTFSTTNSAILKVDLQNHLEFNSRFSEGKKSNEHNDRNGRGTPALTFFAPSNAAWDQLPRELVIFLFSPWGERALRKLIQFHTIPEHVIFSEWGRSVDESDKSAIVIADDRDLSFEWDHHFESAMSQKLPVHVTKWKNVLPGSQLYNFRVQAHGVEVKVWDNVAQNGALHVLDDVLCPRQKQGTDKAQNAKDWLEWKDWFFDWVKEVSNDN